MNKEAIAFTEDFAALFPISAARLEEYHGPWMIHEERGRLFKEQIRNVNITLHLNEFAERQQQKLEARRGGSDEGRAAYQLVGDIAIVSISGTMMKQESSFSGASTIATRRSIRQAVRDPSVQGILLLIDSPGGSTSGVADLAADVAAADAKKPVWTYAEDCMCSAAYWTGSQGRKVFANANAIVGSIGTYTVVRDFSKADKADGIETFVVRAGKFKGMGTPGTEITEEQLAELQRTVDAVQAQFSAGVMSGRKMTAEQVNELATGAVWVGKAAVEAKLIDGVQSLDQTLADFQTMIQGTKGKAAMTTQADKTTETKAATIAEIKAACPGANDSFVLKQLEAGATVQAAQTAFIAEQKQQIEAAKAEQTKAEKELQELKASGGKKHPGVEGLKEDAPGGTTTAGKPGAVEAWNAKVRELMAEEKLTKAEAVKAAARREPQMHADYLNAVNTDPKLPKKRPANFAA